MINLLKKLGVFAWNSTVAVIAPTKAKFHPVTALDLQDFAAYLQKKTDYKTNYRVSGSTLLEYGVTPQRFLLTTAKDNTIVMSFFLCGDPTFSAIAFTLAREFFGKERTFISDSFLYRADGTVCLNLHSDFAVVYIEYLNKVLRGSRSSVKSSNELN